MLRFSILVLSIFLFVSPVWSAVELDGTDDRISLGSQTDIADSDAFTVCLWFNANSIQGERDILFTKMGSAGSPEFGFNLHLEATTDQLMFYDRRTSAGMVVSSADNAITTGVWHHACIGYTNSTSWSNQRLYLDGVDVADSGPSSDGSGSQLGFPSSNAAYSGRRGDNTQPLDATIGEIAVWDVQLTGAEMTHLASSRIRRLPLQISPNNLVAYWTLDDEEEGSSADGDTFIDFSSSGYNATGDDGANNTGLTARGEEVLSY